MLKNVLVTGGAGYVGAVLVPKLLAKGHTVKVVDLYIYGEQVLDQVRHNPRLIQVKGDIRSRELLEWELKGADAVIHLACISNDPSYELDPDLGKSINYDASVLLYDLARGAGVRRFIFASSSSVYGIKDEENVTEDLPLEPLTDYSKYKALFEEYIRTHRTPEMASLILRPSTVCGYSPRLRLDLSVNILTNHAVNRGRITVFGGEQQRPNIHIEDMTDLYVQSLDYPDQLIDGKVYNAGYENMKMKDIASLVKGTVEREMARGPIEVVTTPTDDNRSYRVSSRKIREELGFVAHRSVEDAVADLCRAFREGKIPDSFDDIRYFNIKTMQALHLT
jgi:nucleoside-diphosphate-sugar epimerase